ncbi:T-cell surface glycoprotein CD5 isoform X2 [Octodon degus]|uniref:T-cell surface glycoprotein CD5 isoform X2 n=1 Tax=Octodon degus TaxID=10160 RepID=A0A6P6DRR8_OCTDE|nr:T-cell surface glycoprotein CD5 isoform X2 [Octodon degus]
MAGTRGPPFASCLSWSNMEDAGFKVKLKDSSLPCQGQLLVYTQNSWNTVCAQSWGLEDGSPPDFSPAAYLCRQLRCGDICRLSALSIPLPQFHQLTCHGTPGSFSNCSSSSIPSWCQPLGLVCLEPPRTLPPPTKPPPPTTPAPTAPPRLWLTPVSQSLQCAGTVEFYSGHLGGAISYQAPSDNEDEGDALRGLGTLVCRSLGCGSFLRGLPGPGAPVRVQWTVRNASCLALPQCFQRAPRGATSQALALLCSGFQPKVQSRLVGGGSACQGTAEVRQGGPGTRWAALCHGPGGAARWEELCREQQCGSAVAFRVLDAGAGPRGLLCPEKLLSQCHELEERTPCRRVHVTCQDPHPPGLAAGTVASVVLALVLLAVLLVVCGPLAYRKLMKRVRQKKQRQWIGPTGMSQSMSFHRSHTATVRSQAENRPASHVDNEYSQPPRNSRLSAYPALEGALRLSAAQLDNSSDSDYDLHTAQRL